MPQRAAALGGLLAAALVGLAAVPAQAATTPHTPTLPIPASTVDPAAAVGGPRLASMGIITDLPAGVPGPPTMRDVSWLVADMDTGDVIAAKAPHARLYPASTLKTLTSIVLLPKIDPMASYAATDADARAGGTRIGLVPGQVYTGRQLFQALLMGSANDAAYALSRVNGGIPKTLAEMNAEAHALGALDTHAADPSGLDAPAQSSSAYDLALIGREAMRNADFRAYVTTLSVAFPGKPVPTATATKGPTKAVPRTPHTASPTTTARDLVDAKGVHRQTYELSNHNTLLVNYPGTIGIKNGFTDKANRTFIAAARRNGHTYVVTEMGGLDYQRWRPSAALLDWAFANGRKARPVGRLVEPGEALPTATPTISATTAIEPGSPATLAAGADAGGVASGGAARTPRAGALSASQVGSVTGSPAPATVGGGALALAAVLGFLGVSRARRRRSRGRH